MFAVNSIFSMYRGKIILADRKAEKTENSRAIISLRGHDSVGTEFAINY